MLSPETRALLTDALRPPEGWRLDTAVATSFSLDLTALLLAPMAFALHETDRDNLDAIDQIALLEALRRYAGRTTLFVQAGGIHPPTRFSVLMQLLEGSVCQVAAPTSGRIFHPKVWVLRFRNAIDEMQHRVLVLSRNLTFDRSWDTVLQLDESAGATGGPDPAALASFVRAMPGLAVGSLDDDHAAQVRDVADTVSRARFDLPPDFTDLQFLPFGIDGFDWPLPADADRALLISPFLDTGSAKRWISRQRHALVLSRPESFDRVGTDHFDDAHEAWTLARPAEVEVGDDATAAERASSEWSSVRDGLHAKTFVFEHGRQSTVVTGSANLTSAAFGGNVEFSVALTGPTNRCGVAAIWEGTKESPGLSRLAERYSPQPFSDEEQARTALELAVDEYHRSLAAQPPLVHLTSVGGDPVDVTLTASGTAVRSPGETFIRPSSLPPIRAAHIDSEVHWRGQARRDVTPFFTVETVAEERGVQVTGYCVIVTPLSGDVGDRRRDAMSEILRNSRDVLRYLSLLLADPRLDVSALGSGFADGSSFEPRAGYRDLVVLEPLIRASLRDDDALERVAGLLEELQAMTNGRDLLPEGFADIWRAVDEARRAIR